MDAQTAVKRHHVHFAWAQADVVACGFAVLERALLTKGDSGRRSAAGLKCFSLSCGVLRFVVYNIFLSNIEYLVFDI